MKTLALAILVGLPPLPHASVGPTAAYVARPVVTVHGDRIVLGDLSPTVPRPLLELDLGPSPAPGRKTTVSRQAVQSALQRVGADESLANALPAQQMVARAAVDLSKASLEQEIVAIANGKLPIGVTAGTVMGARALTLPTGAMRVEVDFGRLRRSSRASVKVIVNERLVERMSVTIELVGTPRAPTLDRDLPRGTLVSSEDVRMEATELDRLPSGALTRPGQLVGKRLTQPGRAGRPIQRAAVKTPPLIERGQRVRVVLEGQGLTITRMAIAQEDGQRGDSIRLKATETNTTFSGRVASGHEVHIDLTGGR